MKRAHSVDQVRAAEADLLAGLPEGMLMERAATGLAVAVSEFLTSTYGRRVLLLVGPGDNGGDALYAGARLVRRGASVTAVLVTNRAHSGGLAALLAAGGRVVDRDRVCQIGFPAPEVIIDGVVGIGARPGLNEATAAVLRRFAAVPVIAVDVPSGVEVDTGCTPEPHVRAVQTVTFGTHKIAHLVEPAASACGTVRLVDIGLTLPAAPLEALTRADVRALLPGPGRAAHKYSRGVVGLRTGSAQYPGAAVLSVAGAQAGPAGMIRYAGPAASSVVSRHPEVVTGSGRAQAWVVGSGSGAAAADALQQVLATGLPTVVDADALAHLEPDAGRSDLVLTPHAGELATMLGVSRAAVEADQLGAARRLSSRFGAVVLLKGPATLIVDPDAGVRVNQTGCPWLATAGAGDVLAGLIGALLAAGMTPMDAASVGAWLHGRAAERAAGSDGSRTGGPMVASQLPAQVRAQWRELTTEAAFASRRFTTWPTR